MKHTGSAEIKKDFVKNVALIAGGSAFGQGLAVLASPILTRLYTPKEFGELAVFVALIAILASVASLRYELAIPLASEEEAPKLLWLSLLLALLSGIGLFIVVAWFGKLCASWLGVPGLSPYLWVLPTGVVLVGLYQSLSSLAIRQGNYSAIAQTKVRQGIGMVISQVALGLFGAKTFGLIVGDVIGRSLGILHLWFLTPYRRKTPHVRQIWQVGMEYWKFPLFSSFSTLINRIGLQLPNLLLASLYGPQVAGWYMLVQKVMGIPSSLVGQSVAQVYVGEASRIQREAPETLLAFFMSLTKRLLILGAFPILVGGLLGSMVFGYIFGSDWTTAGKFLLMLTPMFAIQFVVSPLSQTLIVLRQQEYQLIWDTSRLIVVFLAIWSSAQLGYDSITAVGALSFAMVLTYLVLWIVSLLSLWRRHICMR